MSGRRVQPVVAALLHLPERGFLVSYHEKWHGYALPMRRPRPTDLDHGHSAREALREALDLRLANAVARPIDYAEHIGISARTGQEALYRYHVYQVEPHQDVPMGGVGCRHGFLPYQALLDADLVTWSTKLLVRGLMEDQRVALAVLCRADRPPTPPHPGAERREFLMIHSPAYNGYFFPARRLTGDSNPQWEALQAIWRDTGFTGPMQGGDSVVVEDYHFSPRFGQDRRYVFHAVPIRFRREPLAQLARLEASLDSSGERWRWVPEEELDAPAAYGLSSTCIGVREAVRKAATAPGELETGA